MAKTEYYSVDRASTFLGASVRVVQLRCKRDNIMKLKGSYRIPLETLLQWKEELRTNEDKRKRSEKKTTEREPEAENITEEFTPDEYREAVKRIQQYPQLLERLKDYRKEIEYLRKSLDTKAAETEKLLSTMQTSLESVFLALENQKRQQALEYYKDSES